MFAILSRIELMFQVITRSATAHPTCWGWEIEPRMRRRCEQPGQPELKDRARKKQRRPVGGRPGACMSEAFGGNKAHRGDGPVLKRVWPLCASDSEKWDRIL
jgi:hypothetical protein